MAVGAVDSIRRVGFVHPDFFFAAHIALALIKRSFIAPAHSSDHPTFWTKSRRGYLHLSIEFEIRFVDYEILFAVFTNFSFIHVLFKNL